MSHHFAPFTFLSAGDRDGGIAHSVSEKKREPTDKSADEHCLQSTSET